MAAPDTSLASTRRSLGVWADRLPAAAADLGICVVEPLRVLSLRHHDAPQAIESACRRAGLPALPRAGHFSGDDPLLLWRQPREWLFIGSAAAGQADALLESLAPGQDALVCAVDQSAGTVALALQGSKLDALLLRLMDAGAIPRTSGEGTRARLADIAVIVLRREPQCVWLLADRANDHYLADWLAYAALAAWSSETE